MGGVAAIEGADPLLPQAGKPGCGLCLPVKEKAGRDGGNLGKAAGKPGQIPFQIIYRQQNFVEIVLPVVGKLADAVEFPPCFTGSGGFPRRGEGRQRLVRKGDGGVLPHPVEGLDRTAAEGVEGRGGHGQPLPDAGVQLRE